ncbi:Ig-like domain-containing protein [Litorisediminicola beolgyonensis]|uniref:Ig-like domain-containing protein n=1 Tax=Litorisediminicola beolgyonensis TaxID=1173614 RepID=A0ABW3ZFA8_9RHOB
MADLTLDWTDLGGYGTELTSVGEGEVSTTYDAGGIAVDISFTSGEAGSTAFVYDSAAYVGTDGAFDPNSFLKLQGEGTADTPGAPDTVTSTTVLDFRSTDAAYADEVQNVSFRISDLDASDTASDFNQPGLAAFEDQITIIAYDADGTPTEISFADLGAIDVDGNTVSGTTETFFTDADGSLVVNIAGPVSRIEIVYDNGGTGEQGVVISDVNFSTIDAENGAPIANDDLVETDEDTALIIDPLANDSDPEGDTLTIVGLTQPANGTAVLNDDGTITYTPDPDFNGEDTIPYTITDGNGNIATGEIVVTVNPINDDPVANDDAVETAEDTAITVPVLGNDTDVDGDTLTVTDFGQPANGTAVLNDDGTITYTPNADFTGEDTIPYTVSDGNGGTDEAVLTITVRPVEDSPVANDDAVETPEDTAITVPVLDNDVDAEGDPLTVTSITQPANGTAVLNDDGTITYTPNPDFNGEDTIPYTIDDGNGNTDEAVLVVTVTPVNDDPVAVDDTETTAFATPITVAPLANDSDPEGDPLTVSSIGTPSFGTAVLNDDGTVTYTPGADFTGEDTIPYTIDDGNGGTATANIFITVDEDDETDNLPPTPVDDFATTPSGEPVTVDVLANDTDPEDDPLTVTGVFDPFNGTAVVNPDGTITYTPDEGFFGEDTIPYFIDDGNGNTSTGQLTVTVTVTPERDGIVEGTPGDDLIDEDYLGDPDTPPDQIDNDDAIIPGDNPNDDRVEAGDGDDTVISGDGSDTVEGGDGDDVIDTDATGPGRIDTDVFPIEDLPAGSPFTQADDPLDGFDEDPDPEDDRDSVSGGAGNDTITTGDDRDTIEGGDGADVIDAGIDDDLVFGDAGDDLITDVQGSDTIFGGTGDDTIIAGVDTFSDYPDGATPIPLDYPQDPNQDDGRDLVFGEEGNDLISTGDDRDTISGGDGDDTIDGGIDDDEIFGDDGADSLIGGHGSDTIDGGEGDDYIDGSNIPALEVADDTDISTVNDRDSLVGGAGNDTILGGDDDDTLLGGDGDDLLDGGIDEDLINAGAGDDSVLAGDGDDTVTGEDGSDTIDGGAGDDLIDASGDPATELTDDVDPDPENDRDSVMGGAGNDTITTGDDDDTLMGGEGDDLLDAGIDDDLLDGGAGEDTLLGGEGDDTLLGGADDDVLNGGDGADELDGGDGNDVLNAGSGPDTLMGGAGDDTLNGAADDDVLDGGEGDDVLDGDDGADDLDGGAGDDVLDGGEGDDTLAGGEGADTLDGDLGDDLLDGGAGNDVLDGGEGDDTVLGGTGDDTLSGGPGENMLDGGEGDDVLTGGDGPDTLMGGADDDTLTGGLGDDVLDGGDGADDMDGGAGDDVLDGGDGPDTLDGGAGNDTLNGGAGPDMIDGGADRDVIVVDSPEDAFGDVADGGNEGDDFDVLDLTGAGERGLDWRLVDVRPDDDGDLPSNGIDGTVEFLDGEGNVTGSMDFFNIEQVVPCFTPGTLIATPQGERLIEDLREGDRIITRDNGIQEIRWVGRKDLTGHELARKPHMRPILIQKGSLGPNLPEHDMLVSPNHRVLVNNDKTALYFEEREVLAAAKHLTGLDGVDEVGSLGVSYIHFMFDHHEVVLSNGAWTESFQPGDYSLNGIGNAQRGEILELFPELEQKEGLEAYRSARRSLKKHEAKLLTLK